jgi:hypothetical protein
MAVSPDGLGMIQGAPYVDLSSPRHMAVLLYLWGADHGGTGFYRYVARGIQRIKPQNYQHCSDVYCEELQSEEPNLPYVDHSDRRFAFLGMMPARFNPLVVNPGSCALQCVHQLGYLCLR